MGPVRAQLDVWALEVKEALEGATSSRARAEALGRHFFGKPLLSASPDLADPENFYVHRVLAGRQGHCLSLSAIVLAVGEKLGLPLAGVASPRHFFVRWDDGTTRLNIETTDGGALRDDAFYRDQGIPAEAEKEGLYLRSLGTPEVIAHLLNNEGYILWRRGDAGRAEERFNAAIALQPKLVEAHINLGVAAGARGDSAAAGEHFSRVLRWLPGDALTLLNRSLASLHADRTEDALADIEAAAGLDPKSPWVAHGREAVLSSVLRPENWGRHQDRVLARSAELRRKGALKPGLSAAFFAGMELEREVARRVDREVRFEWRWSEPHPGVPADRFSARWEGFVDLPSDGVWTFFTVANDGVRLWVDGVRIIDDWKLNEGALDRESLTLKAGLHPLRLEYFECERFAGITLQVKRADQDRPLPAGALFH